MTPDAPERRLADLDGHLASAKAALAASGKLPLSARHALLAAVLIDRISDAAYPVRERLSKPALARAGDRLEFRGALREMHPELAAIMDLASSGAEAPFLQVVAAQVAPDALTALPVEDLMVSLYNAGTVPRLVLRSRSGSEFPAQELMSEALDIWSSLLPVPAADPVG